MNEQQLLKQAYTYNPTTGLFINNKTGNVAGKIQKSGYIYITFNKKTYGAHRLAWLYVYGQWPEEYIDHINQDKADNRIINLRDVDMSTNKQNCDGYATNKSSGLYGVYRKAGSSTYYSMIKVGGKFIRIGKFTDPLLAHKAYIEAKKMYHKGYVAK